MTTIRRFTCDDLFTYNNVNLDHFTETYNLPFYLQYLATWPEYCALAEGPGRQARRGSRHRMRCDGPAAATAALSGTHPLTRPSPFLQAMGYILGKAEGKRTDWHGHVTAVTVAPEFRRQRLAK